MHKITFSASDKLFIPLFAYNIKSKPIFILCLFSLYASLNRRLMRFLAVAFFTNDFGTTKPTLFTPSWFSLKNNCRGKCRTFLPLLKTLANCEYFNSRSFLGNVKSAAILFYGVRTLRPFRLRFLSTFLPPTPDILARKPWHRFLLRLLFLTTPFFIFISPSMNPPANVWGILYQKKRGCQGKSFTVGKIFLAKNFLSAIISFHRL